MASANASSSPSSSTESRDLGCTVHGSSYCPDGHYCGTLLASGVITFATDAAMPVYGNIIQLFGVTTQGSLSPSGFTVIGQCEPAWGDC